MITGSIAPLVPWWALVKDGIDRLGTRSIIPVSDFRSFDGMKIYTTTHHRILFPLPVERLPFPSALARYRILLENGS